MTKEINQLFVNEANKIIKANKITRTTFAESIGYSLNAFKAVTKEDIVTVVQYGNLVKFCEVYGYDIDFFIKHEEYVSIKKRQEIENEEIGHNLNNIQEHLSEIKNHFDAIEKSNHQIKRLFSEGVKFSEEQIIMLKNIRNKIGV